MAGLWGVSSVAGLAGFDLAAAASALDPLGLASAEQTGDDRFHLASCRPAAPGSGGRHFYSGDEFVAAVSGELTRPRLDRTLVHELMSDTAAGTARDMRGTFAIAIVCRKTGRVRLVSDRTSQHPCFWQPLTDGLVWASTMAVFCQLPAEPRFDPDWLYEFLFFNCPVRRQTFLEGVERLGPAVILDFDPATGRRRETAYAQPYRSPPTLLDEASAIERGRAVFTEVLERCVDDPSATAIALTSGMDSRTILAFVPPAAIGELITYTYGVPGCLDVDTATAMAAALELSHEHIALDQQFADRLGELCWWTVFLSGGLQTMLRASLPYAYDELARRRGGRRNLLHGAAGDHLFRDHLHGTGNRPHILSHGFHESIQQGRLVVDETFYRGALGGRYDAFRRRIERAATDLASDYGPLGDPDAYLGLLLYEAGPKYFAGEAAIANHWFQVKRPFMDADAVQLACDTPFGVVAASRRSPRQERFRERYYQAQLISRNAEIARLALYDRPLDAYLTRRPWRYHLHSARLAPRRALNRLGPRRPPLEDWSTWFRTTLAAPLARLLGADSRLAEYISRDLLTRSLDAGRLDLLGKLATAEILLRLIERRWRLPDGMSATPGGTLRPGVAS